MLYRMYIWLALCLMALLPYLEGKPKSVSVNLDAKWDSTPMLLEASEFLASEGNENFWGFVGQVSELNPDQLQEETDEAMYHMIQKFSSKYLSPMLQSFMKLSLSLRAYSPTVEMFQQISRDSSPLDCKAFVDVHGGKTCDAASVKNLLPTAKDRPAPPLYKTDHIFPESKDAPVTVILYGELGTVEFRSFHLILSKLGEKKEITYVLRHYRKITSHGKTRLSGYGVELAIKSTEYKAKDDTKVEGDGSTDEEEEHGEDEVDGFMFGKLRELHPDVKEDLKRFKAHLSESTTELAAFKVWQLQDLGLQAAQKVVSAAPNDTLRILRDVSQNFPSEARSLVKVSVKDELKREISKNQQYFENYHGLTAGDSALYLNGIPMDMEIYDIFSLLDIMRSEAKTMEGLFSLGLKGDHLNRLLRLDMSGGSKEEFALDIRHSAVQFINDLETDEKYKGWPNRAQDILRPTYPGMLRHVAKNFFNLVFIVDPVDKDSWELLKMAEAFYVHSVPIRLGLVFVLKPGASAMGDPGVALAHAFDYIKKEESPDKAFTFITDVYETLGDKELTADAVMAEFINQYTEEDVENVFGAKSEHDYVRKSSDDFVTKSGLSDFPQVLINGVPLKKADLTADGFEEGVITQIMTMTPEIQQAVYQGHLHDNHNTLEWLMEKDHVLPRLNSRVLTPPTTTLDLTENIDAGVFDDPEMFEVMTSKDMSGIMAGNMNYLRRNEEDSLSSVSMWIVLDVDTAQGRDLAYAAIRRVKHSHDLRVGFIFNKDKPDDKKVDVNKAVYVAIKTLPLSHAKNYVTKLVKEENYKGLQDGSITLQDLEVHGMDMIEFIKAYSTQSDNYLKVHRSFIEKVLGFTQGQRGILSNGRVLGPLGDEEEFLPEDIELLELYVKQQSAKQIKSELKSMGYKGDKGSDLVMKVGGLLTSKSTQTRKKVNYHNDRNSVARLPADPNSPAFQIEAIVDPASTAAQKMTPILMALKQVANMDITLFMNPQDKMSEMPLKSFYRYVLEPEMVFKPDGSLTLGPSAQFTDLPQKSLLTLGMQPPESWLVEAVRTQYDMDNILLEEVKSGGIQANFDLEYLLLEGHCHDANTGQPPRGLQFLLGTNLTDVVMDTIVMANLGYFQLKANPGAWMLKLREGRSSELYQIASHEHTDTPEGSQDIIVTMGSFKSRTIRVKVSKRAGMEKEKLLDDNGKEEADKGIWDTISSSWSGDKASDDKDQTLNIFSVASGHLYERLLRIMMMSVLKTTKSKVKFWFLKNYLSPSFKDFIPHYAKEYGFEYELVQYKWPRWLNQQKEKQRVIWGYKILFLDVLFPLDVKKIIFVDADQIVRTDLQELSDLDLGGAPYGYTPFCNDRREMDGFRFWKSGYWAGHLAGRRYHISALYVIDLKRFRQIAAGDRLRGQYQGLSQDPNSLSNLDQDLPNNMIHQVAIKSLPQEWLWCETWCSDESKAKAKTIDLCNNPMTKEPKLKAAMRIVPEWKEYDYEIKVFWDSIYGTNTRSQVEYEAPELSPEKREAWRDRIEL